MTQDGQSKEQSILMVMMKYRKLLCYSLLEKLEAFTRKLEKRKPLYYKKTGGGLFKKRKQNIYLHERNKIL